MERPRVPLEQLRVVSPCHEDWGKMSGDDRKRFCSQCERSVHNLSAMTHREVDELVQKADGRLCVHYVVSANGNPVTLSDRLPFDRLRLYVARTVALVAGIATLVFLPATDAQASVSPGARAKLDPARLIEAGRRVPAVSKVCDRLIPADHILLGKIAVPPTTVRGEVPAPRIMGRIKMPQKPNSPPPSARPK